MRIEMWQVYEACRHILANMSQTRGPEPGSPVLIISVKFDSILGSQDTSYSSESRLSFEYGRNSVSRFTWGGGGFVSFCSHNNTFFLLVRCCATVDSITINAAFDISRRKNNLHALKSKVNSVFCMASHLLLGSQP